MSALIKILEIILKHFCGYNINYNNEKHLKYSKRIY